MLPALAVLLALLCAGTMGYAIQRGATCTVAAVDELLGRRSARRLAAMGEASLWVAGGLALASVAGLLPALPAAYPVTGWTLAGGVLLGLGAWINQACVFGAIARLGNGEWHQAAAPLGYYLGCATLGVLMVPAARALDEPSLVLQAAAWLVPLFVLFAAWRIVPGAWAALQARRAPQLGRELAQRLWSPHAATAVIGVTFVAILLLVGSVWAYTDVLAQLARGATMRLALGIGCLAALYAGALIGGRTAGRWRPVRPTLRGVLRSAAGGALMAWGTLLIPGSNDGLILVGMPLLRPYAWLGFATMCAAIAVAMLLARRSQSR